MWCEAAFISEVFFFSFMLCYVLVGLLIKYHLYIHLGYRIG